MDTHEVLKLKDKIICAIMDEPIKINKLRLIERLWDIALKVGEAKEAIKAATE